MTFWAVVDGMTLIGEDPNVDRYPPEYQIYMPERARGAYAPPGWVGNGLAPWGLNPDPLAADVNIFVPCFTAVVSTRPECAKCDFDGSGKILLPDLNKLEAALGTSPGPSAAHASPRIEVVAPADGTILPVGSRKAWVAGYLPDVVACGVQVKVNGAPVTVNGPANLFSTFVTLPTPTPTTALAHSPSNRRSMERNMPSCST